MKEEEYFKKNFNGEQTTEFESFLIEQMIILKLTESHTTFKTDRRDLKVRDPTLFKAQLNEHQIPLKKGQRLMTGSRA